VGSSSNYGVRHQRVLSPRLSMMMMMISVRVHDLPQFLPRSGKKSVEPWSTNYGDLNVKPYPLKSTFSGDHILPLKSAAPPNFYMRYRMAKPY